MSFLRGLGVPSDTERAKALFKKACDAGDKGGCDALRKGGAAPGVATSRPNSSPAQPTQPGL